MIRVAIAFIKSFIKTRKSKTFLGETFLRSICILVVAVLVFVGLNVIYILYPYRNIRSVSTFECSSREHPEDFPRLVHRVWLWGNPPARHLTYMKYCTALNPLWTEILWNETQIIKFLKDHYSWILPLYLSFTAPNSKSNVARYFILLHYGGLYLDTDIACFSKYESIIQFAQGADVILANAYPIGVTNNFFLTKANHSFFKQVVQNLAASRHENYFMPYFRALLQSGTVFVHKNYVVFPCRWQLFRLQIADVYSKGSFYVHYGDSAWHQKDGRMLWRFIKFYRDLSLITVFLFICSVFSIFVILRRIFDKHPRMSRKTLRKCEVPVVIIVFALFVWQAFLNS